MRWSLLTVIDFFSRLIIAYEVVPTVHAGHVKAIYQAGLKSQGISVYSETKPELRVDRGSPNTSGITQEFFEALGAELSFARVRRPTDNALTEVWADVLVKHATPPPGFDVRQSAEDTVKRGHADAEGAEAGRAQHQGERQGTVHASSVAAADAPHGPLHRARADNEQDRGDDRWYRPYTQAYRKDRN